MNDVRVVVIDFQSQKEADLLWMDQLSEPPDPTLSFPSSKFALNYNLKVAQ